MEEYNNFGEFIAKKRESKGLSLYEMATQLGVTGVYLREVETGEGDAFGAERLAQISEILELSDNDKSLMVTLANRKRSEVSEAIGSYIRGRDYVRDVLIRAASQDAGEEDWSRFGRAMMRSDESDTSSECVKSLTLKHSGGDYVDVRFGEYGGVGMDGVELDCDELQIITHIATTIRAKTALNEGEM